MAVVIISQKPESFESRIAAVNRVDNESTGEARYTGSANDENGFPFSRLLVHGNGNPKASLSNNTTRPTFT